MTCLFYFRTLLYFLLHNVLILSRQLYQVSSQFNKQAVKMAVGYK